jgi:hypothetical protein
VHRYLAQKNVEDAAHILVSGMNSMLQYKQTQCATELGILLVKLYTDTQTAVSPATLGTLPPSILGRVIPSHLIVFVPSLPSEVITHHFLGYPEGSDDGRVDFIRAAIK